MRVQFKRDQTRNRAHAKYRQNPSAHRHGGAMLENAQHVEEEMRPAQIHDQQNRRKDDSSDGREPHGRARKLDMMKQDRTERDHCRHSADSAKEKVERNLPSPDRRFHHRLSIIAGFFRNRTAGYVDSFAWNYAFLPSLLAETFETFLGFRFVRHAIFRGAHAPSRAALGASPNALRRTRKFSARRRKQHARRVRSPENAARARRSFISEKMRTRVAPR